MLCYVNAESDFRRHNMSSKVDPRTDREKYIYNDRGHIT